MSLEANRFRIGVFFFSGSILLIAVLIWLTGWFKSGETSTYVCYFGESVQGLENGSSVRYNGVPVGTVESISVAPDGRLVEVVVKIDADFPVGSDLGARLDFVGITGIRVINLRLAELDETWVESLSFDPSYPVIPVETSQLEKLDLSLQGLVRMMVDVDFAGISDNTVRLIRNVNEIMESGVVENLLTTVSETAVGVDSLTEVYAILGQRLNRIARDVEIEGPSVAANVRSLAVELANLSESLSLLTSRTDDMVYEARTVFKDLGSLFEHVSEHPEELIFKNTEEDIWP